MCASNVSCMFYPLYEKFDLMPDSDFWLEAAAICKLRHSDLCSAVISLTLDEISLVSQYNKGMVLWQSFQKLPAYYSVFKLGV